MKEYGWFTKHPQAHVQSILLEPCVGSNWPHTKPPTLTPKFRNITNVLDKSDDPENEVERDEIWKGREKFFSGNEETPNVSFCATSPLQHTLDDPIILKLLFPLQQARAVTC